MPLTEKILARQEQVFLLRCEERRTDGCQSTCFSFGFCSVMFGNVCVCGSSSEETWPFPNSDRTLVGGEADADSSENCRIGSQ